VCASHFIFRRAISFCAFWPNFLAYNTPINGSLLRRLVDSDYSAVLQYAVFMKLRSTLLLAILQKAASTSATGRGRGRPKKAKVFTDVMYASL